jgi:hypothetical protein
VSNTTGGLGALARLRAMKAGGPKLENIPEKYLTPEPVEAVGINPPESLLPPAPPVGAVANPPPSTLEEPAKPKRGRPAGSKNVAKDPVGADAAAFTEPTTSVGVDTAVADDDDDYTYTSVRLEFAEDGVAIVVGGSLRKGETVRQAIQRLKGAA